MAIESKKKAWECYNECMEGQFEYEEIPLGPWTSWSLVHDPKHISFVLARYKFCAKMLEGKKSVVEIGFGDGIGIPIVAQAVEHLHCIDWDVRNVEGVKRRLKHLKNVTFEVLDLNLHTKDLKADALYTVDVLEHIEPNLEAQFMDNIMGLLKPSSVMLTGTPNITASAYASKASEIGHINLKSHQSLRKQTEHYFKHVFMFGMNDELIHTGYGPMCHYIWSLGAEKK